MRIKKTERGFALGEFDDAYGKKCSIQKSSLASTDAIWLGVNNTGPLMGESKNQDVEHGRMHLTKKEVRSLLPVLKRFVETGEIK
jgi:hypothetical protein